MTVLGERILQKAYELGWPRLVKSLRTATMPDHIAPLNKDRQPFRCLSEQAIQQYLRFVSQYPEGLGWLNSTVHTFFDVPKSCPVAYIVYESHADISFADPQIAELIIAYGFEPDHFETLNPKEYKHCFTMRLEINRACPNFALRRLQLYTMLHRNTQAVKQILVKKKDIFAYMESEAYGSKNRRDYGPKVFRSDGLRNFPFLPSEFIDVPQPASPAEGTPSHKRVDVHLKIAGMARWPGIFKSESQRNHLRDLLIGSGFYEIHSKSGNSIFTLQMLSVPDAKASFHALDNWAMNYGGVVTLNIEVCNFFWRSIRQIGQIQEWAPVPKLVKRRVSQMAA